MEPQDKPVKKSNTPARLFTFVAAGAVFYYFFTRTNISVCEYDTITKSVRYKVNLGFKTIEGEITALNPSSQEHKFFNKILTITTNTIDTITFTITNTKGDVVDEVIHTFTGPTKTTPIQLCQK